jgi:hypothetical protein
MSIILTKYGNTVAITTTTNKVFYMSVKQFLNAFTMNKEGPEGPEIMVNGSFTGNANNWTLGAGWTWAADKVTKTPGNTNALQQTGSVILNQRYVLRFTVGGTLGSVTVNVGEINTTVPAGAGAVKIFPIPVNDGNPFRIRFTPDSAFNGSIDGVSLRKKSFLISLDTDRLDESNIDIAAWTIAGNTGLRDIGDVGNAISDLVKYSLL